MLHSSFLYSEMWQEGAVTLRVWIAMMLLSDDDGSIDMSRASLASAAHVTEEELGEALGVLTKDIADDPTRGALVDIVGRFGYVVHEHRPYAVQVSEKQAKRARYNRTYRAKKKAAGE